MKELRDAIESGVLGGRLWFYSNYHCNLACSYCLSESSPRSSSRELPAQQMIAWTREAADIGFTSVGITGGEPFLLPDLCDALAEMAPVLPVLVLTNGTLFSPRLLERMADLSALPLSFQLSLDAADARAHDSQRADGNFGKVVEAISALVELGFRVRIASTGDADDDQARSALCALHVRLGVAEGDHVSRPVVRRGRAAGDPGATAISTDNLPPELTLTADGAFYSPFAATVLNGRVDTDLLVCRATSPLSVPVAHMLRLQDARPPGADATLGIQ